MAAEELRQPRLSQGASHANLYRLASRGQGVGVDAGWVAAIAAVVLAVLTGYGIYKTRSPKRRLSYEVTANFAVIASGKFPEQWAALEVRYGDESISRPRTFRLRITNTGRVEARGSDVEEAFGVRYERNTRIVAAQIVMRTDTTPDGFEIEPAVSEDRRSVRAPIQLLNPRDCMEFQLLVEGSARDFMLVGRAAGFEIRPVAERRAGRVIGSVLRWDLPILLLVTAVALGLNALFGGDYPGESMPSLYGDTAAQAQKELKPVIYFEGKTLQIPSSLPKGTVVYQSLLPGTKITGGQTIDIGYSTGTPPS